MASLDKNHGLLWLLMEIVYYFPVSILLGDPYFYTTEVGLLPTFSGRVVTAVSYSILIIGIIFLKKFLSKNTSEVGQENIKQNEQIKTE
jgi:hypothetical protein